jgi:hypothetical protein
MSGKKKTGVLVGDEVIQMLVQIWIDGFFSGGATALEAAGATERSAELAAEQLVRKLRSDPLAMLAIENEVKETLTGTDAGDKSITIKGSTP